MTIARCAFPSASVVDRGLIDSAYFQDSYRGPLSRPRANVTDIFLAIFAHHPIWMKLILIVRHRIVALFGLEVPAMSDVVHPTLRSDYRVGDTIGVWPIFALTNSELVAGRDNKHLDFRLSVLKELNGDEASVVVSTICIVHNWFGKAYLMLIVPFHKLGVQLLLSRAVAAGRM